MQFPSFCKGSVESLMGLASREAGATEMGAELRPSASACPLNGAGGRGHAGQKEQVSELAELGVGGAA